MMNLMNHNAGWQETMAALEVPDEADIISLEEALRKTEPAQVFKPGEITAYSNWGAALAGYIKEMKKFARVRYAISVLCNLFVTGFVVYFELFNFWV